jgi:hypothetical protein
MIVVRGPQQQAKVVLLRCDAAGEFSERASQAARVYF